MKRFMPAAAALLAATPALAHPGHGPGGGSYAPQHYFTTPEHIGFALVAVLVVAGLVVLTRRRAR